VNAEDEDDRVRAILMGRGGTNGCKWCARARQGGRRYELW
jgi:hypothetical protein